MDVLGDIGGDNDMLEKSASRVIGCCPGASGCVEEDAGDGTVRLREDLAGDIWSSLLVCCLAFGGGFAKRSSEVAVGWILRSFLAG